MTYYTALDVSLRSISICIVDDRGRAIRSEGPGDLENELRGLLRVFGVVLASKVPHGVMTLWFGSKSKLSPCWVGLCCRCSTRER